MKVIKFRQDACPQCDQMDQMLEAMGLLDKAEVVHITDDNRNEITAQFNVFGTPTLIKLNEEGNEVARVTRLSFGEIEELFDEIA